MSREKFAFLICLLKRAGALLAKYSGAAYIVIYNRKCIVSWHCRFLGLLRNDFFDSNNCGYWFSFLWKYWLFYVCDRNYPT